MRRTAVRDGQARGAPDEVARGAPGDAAGDAAGDGAARAGAVGGAERAGAARLRIALIGPAHPYKGGGARHTTELAHHLAAAGHDVVIESWRALYPARLYPGVQTVEVAEGEPYPHTRRMLSWRRPDGWLAAGRRLRRDRDLVVFVYLVPVQVPAYLGILRGLYGLRGHAGAGGTAGGPASRPRAVVLCHNVLPHERRPGDVVLTRALLRRADAIITHTERLASVARSLAPGTPVGVADLPPHLPAPPLAVVPPAGMPDPAVEGARAGMVPHAGVEAARAKVVPPADAVPPARMEAARAGVAPPAAVEVRAGPGPGDAAGPDPCQLLFFGIVRPYKGLDILLRAMASAPGGLRLTVAGEFWGGTDATRALAAELGLTGRVELRPGYVRAGDIAGLLGTADALVLPYRSATASQNAWLAFEHGVPVIATRTGTFAEQVSDGVDGLLCEPGDAASLAGALRRFCQPGMAQRLRAGVRPVAAPALWAAYLDKLLGVARR